MLARRTADVPAHYLPLHTCSSFLCVVVAAKPNAAKLDLTDLFANSARTPEQNEVMACGEGSSVS